MEVLRKEVKPETVAATAFPKLAEEQGSWFGDVAEQTRICRLILGPGADS